MGLGGFRAHVEGMLGAKLDDPRENPVIEVDDLEATLAAVEGAGGTVTLPIFAFPGGRRFHFTDREGHELAAMTPDG